jgi:hypothetical protein
MTLCPIAAVAGCKKCPIFSVCPLKTVIGDHVKPSEPLAAGPKPPVQTRQGVRTPKRGSRKR